MVLARAIRVPVPKRPRGSDPGAGRSSRRWHWAILFGLLSLAARGADDWPTFRGDAQRSGVTPEGLTLPLAPAWTHRPAQGPVPAWPEPMATNYAIMYGPLRQTLTFDRAFHAVADAESVYFGSSADDSIYCLDATTGAFRWRFVTEGPVRLAPALSRGRLFAGSDDGQLYALDARTGRRLWSYRAGPDDRRLPGNGRMISPWPVRCRIVVSGEQVFFTAGLFPNEGVFLCAVEAETGKEVYRRHLEFAAQGTMLASEDRLFLATGRSAFRSCDRRDGTPLLRHGISNPWKTNLVGGTTALVADGILATGPSEDGQFHWFNLAATNPLLRASCDCAVVGNDRIYLLDNGRLSAVDRSAYLGKQERPPPLWSVATRRATTMILAGEGVVVAGAGEVAIHDARDGARLWAAALEGRAEGLAACAGRLFVSLDGGQTLCFQSGAAPPPRTTASPAPGAPFPDNPLLARAAESAIASAGTTKGYCLVLDAASGQLAWEIARRSEFRVVCQESDAAKVDAMRAAFMAAGLYGHRIEVHRADAGSLPYPRYFANLIVSEGALVGNSDLPPPGQVLRVLRPCGGVAHFAARSGTETRRRLDAWGRPLPGWHVSDGEVAHGTARRGPLPGSGEWTHFYADPGNTGCSNDEIRYAAMGVHWFGRPGPTHMIDRHKKGPAPLYANGRLFVPGFNYFAAVDAYNGFVLWERRIPDSARIGAFKDSSGMAATDSHLLVASGDSCLALDAQSGEIAMRIPVATPASDKAWGYLATTDGLVIGSVAKARGSLREMGKLEDIIIWRNEQPVVCSTSVFAVERSTGKRLWEYPARTGAIPNPSIAIGNGKIYFVESGNPETLRSEDGRINVPELVGRGARLVALDLKTGATAWARDVDLSSLQHILFLSCAKETLLITGSRYVDVDPSETEGRAKPKQLRRVRYDLFAFDARSGDAVWKNTAAPNYDEVLTGSHGEQVQHPAIVGGIVYGPAFAFDLATGEPHGGWKWEKSHKCATLSASRHCAFSRFAEEKLPYIFDLRSGEGTPLSTATRPGCWINTIPAGGLILIPEASAGCTCEYPFQTSLALAPAEE